jgi:hypothetical protein
MQLSIVLGGRDDNYGKYFIERLNQALNENVKLLNASGLSYEIIIVDFNPLNNQYLHKNPILKEILSDSNVKNFIVDNTVLINENLPVKNYYEYFAKNAGIRKSSGDFIFITNSDIILSEKAIDQIKLELNSADKDEVFYRVKYRGSISLFSSVDSNIWLQDLHIPNDPDELICGMFSGDASMFSQKVMELATGYNEHIQEHRSNLSQSSMDGEILWNLVNQGKKLKLINAPYYHIAHERPNQRDGFYNKDVYKNHSGWGFNNYPVKILNDNTFLITRDF